MESGRSLCKVAVVNVGSVIEEKLEPTLATLGFQRVNGLSNRWQYNGKYIALLLYFDPRGEISFSVTSLNDEPPVDLWRFLGQSDLDWPFAGSIMFSDINRLGTALERLSGLLARSASLLTSPNDLLLPRLRKVQNEEARKGWQRDQLETVLRQATKFWRAKRYREFSELLEPWEAMLTPAMIAKLSYCRRHLP